MLGRSVPFRPENLGQSALRQITNLCFAAFVILVLIFTIIAATYSPDDPLLLHPTTKLTSFLTSTSNATFLSDSSLLRTGEDFLNASSSSAATNETVDINIGTLNPDADTEENNSCNYKKDDPIDCKLPEVFHAMMSYAVENYKDIHFYKFGKPVTGR